MDPELLTERIGQEHSGGFDPGVAALLGDDDAPILVFEAAAIDPWIRCLPGRRTFAHGVDGFGASGDGAEVARRHRMTMDGLAATLRTTIMPED
jgi:hypothetical protein